jgi:hypothetical protein
MVPLEAERGAENRLLPARSGILSLSSGSSPSSQAKAAAAQDGDRNWEWEKILESDYMGSSRPQ